MPHNPPSVRRSGAAQAYESALAYCFRLLSKRPYTAHDLRTKLAQRGVGQGTAGAVLERLAQLVRASWCCTHQLARSWAHRHFAAARCCVWARPDVVCRAAAC